MRLKEVFYLLGLRPKPKEFGFEIHTFDLPEEGQIEYAQWLHSSEGKKHFAQESIDELRTFLAPGDVAPSRWPWLSDNRGAFWLLNQTGTYSPFWRRTHN